MKKRVLFIIHDLGYGGAEKVLVNLVNHLDKSKFDVTIHTLFDVGENKKFLNSDVNYIGGWKWMFRGNAPLMRMIPPKILSKIVIKDVYDIVVSFLEGPCTRIVSAYQGKKVAWIHTDFETLNQVKCQYKSYDEMCKCYNRFDMVACVAETVKNRFLTYLHLQVPCKIFYNVNDTELITKKSKEKQYSIIHEVGCYNIISVGRLIPLKKYDKLILIHKQLLENGVNNKLYILGEGEEHSRLQKLIDKNVLNDTCKLLGFNENPYKYVSSADLFVCSSDKEGFSTAVTEALVLGIPVVSTEVSGANELLGYNNEYGIVTENSQEALYDGIHRILTDVGTLEYYKKQAELRGKEFSTEKTTEAVEIMLENL